MSTSDTKAAWASGGSIFAASMMIVVGTFQFLEGLIAVIDGGDFLIKTRNYVFQFDATAWGWIHLVLGVLVAAAGIFVFTGNVAARGFGILIAGLSAVANFAWLPYYPFWSIIVIALDVYVIWALCSVRLGDEY